MMCWRGLAPVCRRALPPDTSPSMSVRLMSSAACPQPATDLLNALVRPEAKDRLGAAPAGMDAVRAHAFFDGFDWAALAAREMRPPIPIKLMHALDTRLFEQYDEEVGSILGPQAQQALALAVAQGAEGAGAPGSGASLLIDGKPWDDAF